MADTLDERVNLCFTKNNIKVGTWNVRVMTLSRLEIVKKEMIRCNFDILGVSELHWKGDGFFQSDDHTVYFSGKDNIRRESVAFIVNKKVVRCISGYNASNERIILIKINSKPMNINFIQVYVPTIDSTEEEVEAFYNKLHNTIKTIPRKEMFYVLGDFNAKVGTVEEPLTVEKHGLGERNKAGDCLIQFCLENDMIIMNTIFKQHKRHLYTWTSPSGQYRDQIDYVLCQKEWRSSITVVKTLSGTDCNSDHQLLMAKMKLRLCSFKPTNPTKRVDVEKVTTAYAVEVKNRFEALCCDDNNSEDLWRKIKQNVLIAAEITVPYKTKKKNKKWLMEETLKIGEKRKRWQAKANAMIDEFKKLNNDF
ncbi:craniofacial development protein 2-like [Centruroides vittatus]|uniref:craniofacial development protein 2-like n=1 Tax=Centruroides vittatus TaxID=120091 RepID=UPI00350FB9F2